MSKTIDEIRHANLMALIALYGQTGLADRLGYASPATISQLANKSPDSKTGAPKKVGDKVARKIEIACGKPVGWMDQVQTGDKASEIDLDQSDEFIQIKRSTLKLSAGITGYAIEPLVHDELPPIVFRKDWFESRKLTPGKLLAVKVKGESMLPGLSAGDTVVIDTEQNTPKDGAVFAVNYEGELVIKRISRDAGAWWLLSDNPDQARYPRKQCSGEECLVIGRIIHKQSEYI